MFGASMSECKAPWRKDAGPTHTRRTHTRARGRGAAGVEEFALIDSLTRNGTGVRACIDVRAAPEVRPTPLPRLIQCQCPVNDRQFHGLTAPLHGLRDRRAARPERPEPMRLEAGSTIDALRTARPCCLMCSRTEHYPQKLSGPEAQPRWKCPQRSGLLTWFALLTMPSATFFALVAPLLVGEIPAGILVSRAVSRPSCVG